MQNAGQCSTTFCTKAELKLLRALLVRNSRRMQPTKWQVRNLPLNSPTTHWMASYITPVYPEVLGNTQTLFDAIPELGKSGNASGVSQAVRTATAAAVAQMHEQASSSGAAGGSRPARSLSAGSARAATAEDLLRESLPAVRWVQEQQRGLVRGIPQQQHKDQQLQRQ